MALRRFIFRGPGLLLRDAVLVILTEDEPQAQEVAKRQAQDWYEEQLGGLVPDDAQLELQSTERVAAPCIIHADTGD